MYLNTYTVDRDPYHFLSLFCCVPKKYAWCLFTTRGWDCIISWSSVVLEWTVTKLPVLLLFPCHYTSCLLLFNVTHWGLPKVVVYTEKDQPQRKPCRKPLCSVLIAFHYSSSLILSCIPQFLCEPLLKLPADSFVVFLLCLLTNSYCNSACGMASATLESLLGAVGLNAHLRKQKERSSVTV